MTPKKIKAQFQERGECPGRWADQHGFDRGLIYRILNGRAACLRGKSYEAARALGLKTPIVPGT